MSEPDVRREIQAGDAMRETRVDRIGFSPFGAIPDRFWWACAEPERPTDPYVRWHYEDCLGCRVKAQALRQQFPDDSHVEWLVLRMAA